MKYFEDYELADFVMDNSFRRWVLQPDYELESMLRQYLVANPEKSEIIDEAREIVLALQVKEKSLSSKAWEEMYAAFESKIKSGSVRSSEADLPVIRRWWRYPAVAGIAIIIAGAAIWMYKSNSEISPSIVTSYKTAYSEIKKVVLPDSSIITLNANSTLRLAENWNDTLQREVWLEGEAFFEITKKPDAQRKNFVVHTHDMNIEVLGTKFDVKTVNAFTRVVLSEGKVNIKSSKNHHADIVMQPGEAVILKSKQLIPVKEKVKADNYKAWTDNKFILNNTTMQEIADFIEEYYGRHVRFASEDLTKIKIDGTSLPIDDESVFLSIIEKVTGATLLKSDNEILITR